MYWWFLFSLHESHKNLSSQNPIWKQLPLPCLEGLCLDDLCFEAMVGRSTGIAYVFLSRFCSVSVINNLFPGFLNQRPRCNFRFIGQAIEGYDGQEDGIKFLGSWKSDRRCFRLNQWYCFFHECLRWIQVRSFVLERKQIRRSCLRMSFIMYQFRNWWTIFL